MKRTTALILAAAVCGGGQAQSYEEPIVITASRTPQTADDALASVSVLTREDIDASPAQDVPDLLNTLPGVGISRNGGRGQNSSVFLRGTNSGHTLVLVDGVGVGSATAGGTALESLPLQQIERIEVVRGPRSTLYGADAIGGVIQIFTRRHATYLSIGGGSQGTGSIGAGVGGSTERARGGVSFSGFRTDGFDATDEDNFSPDPDRDGFRQGSVNLQGEYDATADLTLDASLLHSESQVEFDGMPDETESNERVATLGADWRVNRTWRSHLQTAQSLNDQDSRRTGGDRFITRRAEASWQNDLFLSDRDTLTLGLDYRRDRVDGIDFAEDSRDNRAAFAQYQHYGDGWDVQTGLRHDDNEAYGGETTGNLAAGYRFDSGVRVFASHGTAFKAPTFNDLFHPDVGFFAGNPDLEPERSRSSEIGVEGGTRWRWRIDAFHTEIDDLIVYDAANGRNENVNEARIRGVEGSLGTTLAGTDATLGLTWLDAEDAATGNSLPRRPPRSVSLDLARDIGPVRAGVTVRYDDGRFDDLANTTELDAATVVDLSAAWRFTRDWTLRGELTNAFDEDYQTANTYNAPGRAVFVSLDWRPAE